MSGAGGSGPENGWQKEVLKALRGEATARGPEHVDIETPDGPAFARLDEAGRVRLSLFLNDLSTPDAELRETRALLPRPTAGVVDVVESDAGDVLRLLNVLDRDADFARACERAADEARLLRDVARHGSNAWDLPLTLGDAGVVVPPRGDVDNVSTLERWHWANVTLDRRDLYLFEVDAVLAAGLASPTFALCHFGHGVNSYGLTLLVTCGPIAAFVQHGYGGVYMDRLGSLDAIAHTYNRLRVLFEDLGDDRTGPPQWLLLYSDFRSRCSLVRLEHERGGTRIVKREDLPDEDALHERVRELVHGSATASGPSARAHDRHRLAELGLDELDLRPPGPQERGSVVLAGEGEAIRAYDDPGGAYLLFGGGSIELPDGEIVGGSWTRSFSSAEEREQYLQDRYGEALRRYRAGRHS